MQLDSYGEAAYKGSSGLQGGWQRRLVAVAGIGPLNVINELSGSQAHDWTTSQVDSIIWCLALGELVSDRALNRAGWKQHNLHFFSWEKMQQQASHGGIALRYTMAQKGKPILQLHGKHGFFLFFEVGVEWHQSILVQFVVNFLFLH